ncbi:hypothetical protein [Sinorhizobium meliloti]|uniref:hypothetical protein n=1 Tax=Rhizobium meliloti TaxID=382 RepID=UPI0013E365E2|nr:hypothetical protein [Sinorhizobium meliloti]
MTENTKTPPAKKTIQDPPEYAVAPGEATWSGRGKASEQHSGETEAGYQQNGQQAIVPAGTGNQAKTTEATKDWLGGPQDGAEAPASDNTEKSGDWLGGPQNGAEAPASKESGPTGSGKAQGEGARNPQTGERIARNPQTGE